MPSTRTNESSPQDMMPESPWRTLITFLLFLHLFAIGVGTVSTYQQSHLERQLRDVPGIRPYVQLLGLDVPYVQLYSLTCGRLIDRDFSLIVAEVDPKKKPEELGVVQLPPPDMSPLERRRRYDHLARKVGMYGGLDQPLELNAQPDEAGQASLVTMAGAHVLKEKGWDRCRVRCVAHSIPEMQHTRSIDPAERDPFSARYYETIYEAEVWFNKRGVPQIQKIEAASDMAPASTPSTSK